MHTQSKGRGGEGKGERESSSVRTNMLVHAHKKDSLEQRRDSRDMDKGENIFEKILKIFEF